MMKFGDTIYQWIYNSLVLKRLKFRIEDNSLIA